ncbi:hypothetical protein NM688_g312 [Phlebia brevispora]|uniref:Uncharacterized protein n=1 Tax=Phlebia brevispora TaxID=194682 RepID=A0ACC1TEE2_9APHY|nr:hypothetical protein NM688_g312 [Phlebia brevispora]
MVAADSPEQREEFLAIVRAWETKDLWMIASRKKVIKSSDLFNEGINLSQAAIDAGLDSWFRAWGRIWNACNAHLNDYFFNLRDAKKKNKPLPAMDWETVNGYVTRDNLRKYLAGCTLDPDASPVDLANAEDALSLNATTALIAEAAPVPDTNDSDAIDGKPSVTADVVSEDVSPVGTLELAAATHAANLTDSHMATVHAGGHRMKTRASTRLAAAKAASPAARKAASPATRKARPGGAKAVTRRARSPTREQSVEIAKKAKAAAKRTAKKANAAAKKTTKEDGHDGKESGEEGGYD